MAWSSFDVALRAAMSLSAKTGNKCSSITSGGKSARPVAFFVKAGIVNSV